jgi:hypothetical protein
MSSSINKPISKSIFKSVHNPLRVPPALLGGGGGGPTIPADAIRNRANEPILDRFDDYITARSSGPSLFWDDSGTWNDLGVWTE